MVRHALMQQTSDPPNFITVLNEMEKFLQLDYFKYSLFY